MTKRKSTIRTIEEDTGILTIAMAEIVVEKAARLVSNEGFGSQDLYFYVGRLTECAETQYHSNPTFQKKVQGSGNKGRDYLYAFMQHWISSMLLKNSPAVRRALVGSGFSMGKDL